MRADPMKNAAFATAARIGRALCAPALALVLAAALAAPAMASESRPSVAGLLPVKESVGAPQGASALCATYAWACAKSGKRVTVDAAMLQVIKDVNSRVNRSVRPVNDITQYGTAERWALPTRRGGDCEDYALLKKKELIAAGLAPEQLLIATVLDRKRQSHAVLVVRTGKQDLVLDNLTGRIMPWQQTGYTFLRVQNPAKPSGWVAVLAGGIFNDDAVAKF
jgi:predicted transglutaminase-like cysteine proteinase